MIIPDDAYPSWTNADARDANLYSIHRQRLWFSNYCVSIWPQIFSWMVVNIYPASSEHDYRFEPQFANRAILVTVDWDRSGRGCRNSKCYATYPPGNRCTMSEAPIVFPSGNKSSVVACQPACFARQRTRLLLKTADQEVSLTDQSGPSRSCPDCAYLNERVAFSTRRWRFGGSDGTRIDVFDSRTKKIVGVQHERIGRTPVERDEHGSAKLKVDLFNVVWDEKYDNCIVVNDYVYRSVVEPLYRDPGVVCKLTNFELGDDVEWGFRYAENSSRVVPNYGFLVKHSSAYCRAFAKDLTSEGECKQPWWQSALANTIAGDGIIHAIHSLVHYDPDCVEPWRTQENERAQTPQTFEADTVYDLWRRDVNDKFILPPPNVTLSDLGINVLLTGNRLYWNSAEGIISQFALFRSVTNTPGTVSPNEPSTATPNRRNRPLLLDSGVENERMKYQRYTTKPPKRRWGKRAAFINRLRRETGANEAMRQHATNVLTEYRDLLRAKIERFRDRAAMEGRERERHARFTRSNSTTTSAPTKLPASTNTSDDPATGGDSDGDQDRTWDRRSHGSFDRRNLLRDADIDSKLGRLWRDEVRPLLDRVNNDATGRSIGGYTSAKVVGHDTTNEELYPSSAVTDDEEEELTSIYTRAGSVSYTLETNELAAQRYVESRLADDEQRKPKSATATATATTGTAGMTDTTDTTDKTNTGDGSTATTTSSPRLLVPSTARTIGWRSGEAEDPDLKDLLEHIQEEIEHGEASTLLQDLGIAVGFEVADRLIRKSLKFAFTKISQILSRHTSGTIGMSLMKIGMRVGLSKMFGNVAARLTTKVMVMIGQAASIVGLIIDTISFVSLLFDIAELAGWDPGSFRNEQDTRFYYDMSVYFAETLTDTQRGPLSPLEMMLIFTTDDTAADGNQKGNTNETAVNDNADNTGTQEESGSTKTQHIDERLRYPKWFNKQFTACFPKNAFDVFNGVVNNFSGASNDPEHVVIQDSAEIWGLVTCMDYLGSLTTNSFGQRIVSDPVNVRLRDEDLSNLVTEIEYRDLLTISTRSSVDSTSFNHRVNASNRIQVIGLAVAGVAGVGTVVSLIGSNLFNTYTGTRPPWYLILFDFNVISILIVFCALVGFLYASLSFVPVPVTTIASNDLSGTTTTGGATTRALATTTGTGGGTGTTGTTDKNDNNSSTSAEHQTLHYYADTLRNFATTLS